MYPHCLRASGRVSQAGWLGFSRIRAARLIRCRSEPCSRSLWSTGFSMRKATGEFKYGLPRRNAFIDLNDAVVRYSELHHSPPFLIRSTRRFYESILAWKPCRTLAGGFCFCGADYAEEGCAAARDLADMAAAGGLERRRQPLDISPKPCGNLAEILPSSVGRRAGEQRQVPRATTKPDAKHRHRRSSISHGVINSPHGKMLSI